MYADITVASMWAWEFLTQQTVSTGGRIIKEDRGTTKERKKRREDTSDLATKARRK